MYYNFTPSTSKKIYKHHRPDSLSIDNQVIEYTFTKKRSKTPIEIQTELLCRSNRFFSPVKTLVSVYIYMTKIKYVKYDASTETLLIAGHFSVSYRNMHSQQETSREYDKNIYCISFKYEFNDVDKFLEIVSQYCKSPEFNIPVIPLSL